MNADPPPLPDLDAMQAIISRLNAARVIEPRLANAEPGDLIRHVPGKRAIFHGQLDGRRVIFRMNLGPEDSLTQEEWEQLQRLWPHMATGDLRTPEPICAAPAAGVIAQSYISGTPLLEHLHTLEPAERCQWLAPAAAWLRKSTALSEDWRAARPQGWIKRAARASQTQPFPRLRAVELQILEQMQRLAPLIEAEPWRVAICHGDYHPNNLIADGTSLTGIDLGGTQYLPVLKDIARFAVHLGRRRIRLSDRNCFGVDQACLSSFAEVFVLNALEKAVTLPFFLGFEALIKVEDAKLPVARVKQAEAMYRALLQDLQRVDGKTALI